MATLQSQLILRLVDQVTGPAKGVQRAIRQTDSAIERNNRAIARTSSAFAATAAAAAGAAYALAQPVKAAMRFEEAMADVRKVVDFPTPDGFQNFRNELFALSREIPMTVQQLAEIAAAGGSSGLEGDQLIKFTEMTAKLGTAFDISAGSAGDFVNSMRNSLGLTLDETMGLSDAVNHLTNSMAATAPEMTNFMTGVAGDLKAAGFVAEEAAAFGAAMQAAGHSAEVSATSFRNMARALTRGGSATKRQSDAFAKLGLDATDVARRMQEDAVGTTVEVMDAIGRLPEEVRASVSSDLFGDEARALTGLISNTDLLREALGYVADEGQYAGSALKEYAARSKTFSSDLQRFQNVMAELSITIGEALLPALSDTMEQIKPFIDALISWSRENSDLVRTVVKTATALVGMRLAFLGLKLAGLTGKGGVLWALSGGLHALYQAARGASAIGRAATESARLQAALAAMDGVKITRLDRIKASIGSIARLTGLGAVATGFSAFAGAVATISAPVWGAIALAVAAIGAAGTAIYKNWDQISSIVSGVADAIGERLKPVLDKFKPILDKIKPLIEPVGKAFKVLGDGVKAAIEAVKSFFTGGIFDQNVLTDEEKARVQNSAKEITSRILDAIAELPGKLYDAGVDAIQSLWNGMSAKVDEMVDWVRDIPGLIMGAIGSIDLSGAVTTGSGRRAADRPVGPGPVGENDASSGSRGRLGRRALGGPIAAGIPYLVNENTPRSEVIVPSVSGAILNVPQAQSAMTRALRGSMPSRSRGPVTLSFGDIVIQGGANATADDIGLALGRHAQGALASHFSDVF
ncbi:phage tail tape measure protein [Roseovarius confluentis]|uniref:phage tail tape measure protein n=1 Tax=Roseovarius confluentis TaxID=1852027 RepID=UPI003BABD025